MIPRHILAPGYAVSRLVKGGWHLAGDHGAIDPEQARRDMAAFIDAGITTFDCADIYTGVEELIGSFRVAYPQHAARMQVHTKFVPDLSGLDTVDRGQIEAIIDRSLKRLAMERLDVVQFHWWDYESPRYVEAALELVRLQQAGKIAHIAVTNFDTPRLAELIAAGVPVISNQVQYSLLDDRPAHGMVDFGLRHGVALLCYGTVSGGFLSDRWLGRPEPTEAFANRSLVKYQLIIDEFGGWALFQALLAALARVASRHGTDIATIATRWVLDRAQVAAAIVGATNASHLPAHERIASFALDDEDRASIASVTDRRRGPAGDIYDLERDRHSPHGSIMKYELNAQPSRRNP